MKALILCSLVLLATATYQWPSVDVDNPASASDSYTDSDSTDEYTSSDASDTAGACWAYTYGRVAQQPLQGCAEGLVLIGSFCYDPCQEGYSAGFFSGIYNEVDQDPSSSEDTSDVGSYCWENCPEDYTDYEGSLESCQSISGTDSFNKNSYNRTYVEALQCATGLEMVNGLCYEPPQEGYRCEGSFCYGKCPNGWTICGALCTKLGVCTGNVIGEGFAVEEALQNMAAALTSASDGASVNPLNVAHVNQSPTYPWCH